MGIVVGALILGWFLGYASAKWKSLLATLKKSADQAKKDRALSAAKAKMESAGAGEDEAEQEEDEEKKAKEEAQEVLEEFLSRDAAPGLDDHPDSFVNPIIMLQIKLAKEEVRRRKALDALIKAQEYDEGYWESLSPEEQAAIERKLLESTTGPVSGGVGSVGGMSRRWGSAVNSTRILVDNGASFAPGQKNLADLMDLQEKAALELREKWKQIDQHLEKVHEIDVARVDRAGQQNKRAADGSRIKDALTVAKETQQMPFEYVRQALTYEERRDMAQRGRSRVAPPLDHAGGAVNTKLARRASVNALRGGGGAGGEGIAEGLLGGE